MKNTFYSANHRYRRNFWNIGQETMVQRFEDGDGLFTCLSFSADGRYLSFVNKNRGLSLRFADIIGETMRFDSGSPVQSHLFLPNGQNIVTSHQDGSLVLWE